MIEAMAAGVPGVSTDVGGVRDVITSPDIGVLVPPGNATSLAQAVHALWDRGESARRQMGQRARQAVLTGFTLDRLVVDVDALYQGLTTSL